MTTFDEMALSEPIQKALRSLGFTKPSAIQEKAIPLIQEGKDVIGLAQTGSGKTAACMIPIADRVDSEKKFIQTLIIVPTRELALQYATEAQNIGRYKGVKAYALFGGEDQSLQLAKMNHGVQILVATPGRLIDFIYQRLVDLSQVSTLILDEADEMLSMGFLEDLEFIIQCLIHEHQTLLFSATMPKDIKKIALNYMKSPKEVKLHQQSPLSIDHVFFYCHPKQKQEALVHFLKKIKLKQSIIFCQSRLQCEELTRYLKKQIKDVDLLHGGLSQSVRTTITDKFRTYRIKHLIATDVAARGLDFSQVTHVFLFQIGKDVDTYVHRAGRTGRQDRKGTVISFVSKADLRVVQQIEKRLGKKGRWIGPPPPLPSSQQNRKASVQKAQQRRRPPRGKG